ncbi:collagen alpha-2(VIII) chain-like [Ostrea edulis]|uniref:collagen alpha-2(VIII) chain-like n=1 Tax=Ostrea edulis TaxID=37623 RepID=UPI0024AF3EB4|nr:collagen alpha-2(VIII) chain-like [Ostrea edulis]
MPLPVFFVIMCAICSFTTADKKSPRPSLKTFRDDYATVVKTCEAVGYVRDKCKAPRRHMIVAFDAKASQQTVSQGKIVKFGTVDLQIGGGYNGKEGIFTAPKSGIYVFDWTTVTQNSYVAHTALNVNGKRKAYLYCHNKVSGMHNSCSKMAIVRLDARDRVWIDCLYGTAYVNKLFSSFSGFML